MEIEVRKLNALKRYEGSFAYDYTPPRDICLIPLCNIDGEVKVEGAYEICDDGKVWVDLTVNYKISGQCSYCLKPALKQITFTTEILYDVTDNNAKDKDDDHYKYDGIKINLQSAVDDAILLSQPNILLCSDGCTGIDVTNK